MRTEGDENQELPQQREAQAGARANRTSKPVAGVAKKLVRAAALRAAGIDPSYSGKNSSGEKSSSEYAKVCQPDNPNIENERVTHDTPGAWDSSIPNRPIQEVALSLAEVEDHDSVRPQQSERLAAAEFSYGNDPEQSNCELEPANIEISADEHNHLQYSYCEPVQDPPYPDDHVQFEIANSESSENQFDDDWDPFAPVDNRSHSCPDEEESQSDQAVAESVQLQYECSNDSDSGDLARPVESQYEFGDHTNASDLAEPVESHYEPTDDRNSGYLTEPVESQYEFGDDTSATDRGNEESDTVQYQQTEGTNEFHQGSPSIDSTLSEDNDLNRVEEFGCDPIGDDALDLQSIDETVPDSADPTESDQLESVIEQRTENLDSRIPVNPSSESQTNSFTEKINKPLVRQPIPTLVDMPAKIALTEAKLAKFAEEKAEQASRAEADDQNNDAPAAECASDYPNDLDRRRATMRQSQRMKAAMQDAPTQTGSVARQTHLHLRSAKKAVRSFVERNKIAVIVAAAVLVLVVGSSIVICEQTKAEKLALIKQEINEKHYTRALSDADAGLKQFFGDPLFRFCKAQALANLGWKPNALKEILLASRARPNDLEIISLRAKLYTDLGQLQSALFDYNRLTQNPPFGQRASSFADKATVELMIGEWQNAMSDISTAMKIDPNNPSYYAIQAKAFTGSGDYTNAVKAWDTVISMTPNNASAYAERARAEYQNKDTKKALSDLSASIKLTPTAQAYFYRGLIRKALKSTSSAISDFTTALQYDPSNTAIIEARGQCYAVQGDLHNSLRSYDTLTIIRAASDSPSFYQARSAVEFQAGRYKQALEDLDRAISKLPDDFTLRLRRVECLEKLGDLERAYIDYGFLIAHSPKRSSFYIKRAIISGKQHKYDIANADFEQAIEIDPNNAEIYISRAALSKERNLYNECLTDLKIAFRLQPSNAALRQQISEITRSMRNSTIGTERLAAAVESAALEPPVTKGDPVSIGYNLMIKGNYSIAIDKFAQAIKTDPNNIRARRYLAHCLNQAGQFAQAVTQFSALRSLTGLDKRDQSAFAKALAASGKYKEAAALYEKHLQQDPSDIKVRLALATIYSTMGDKDRCKEVCSEGIRLADSDEQVLELSKLMRAKPNLSESVAPTTATAPLE